MSEPTKITEKYLAGFVDSDGTFGVRFVRSAGGWSPRMFLEAAQEIGRDKVIHLIQRTYGGYISQRTGGEFQKENTSWSLPCKQARMVLSRIRKYLVTKRAFADFCIAYSMKNHGVIFDDAAKAVERERLTAARALRSDPLPNYPSRQWLAGYFDGDGCLASGLRENPGCTSAVLQARVEDDRKEGLELLRKAFGGNIYKGRVEATQLWVLNLEPSQAKEFLSHFAKHAIVKRGEIYFALGCADGGNYRDGKPIHRALQHLKSQEQRLSDPEVNVSSMLREVRFDIPDGRGRYKRTLKRQSTEGTHAAI